MDVNAGTYACLDVTRELVTCYCSNAIIIFR